MKKYLPWRCMNLMCGANRNWLKAGKALTVGGLIMAAVGYAVTSDCVYTFDHPGDHDYAMDFTEAVINIS